MFVWNNLNTEKISICFALQISFGVIGLSLGVSLLSWVFLGILSCYSYLWFLYHGCVKSYRYGFGAYFNILPGSEWSAIMLTYGFPLAIIGMALKVCHLLCLLYLITLFALQLSFSLSCPWVSWIVCIAVTLPRNLTCVLEFFISFFGFSECLIVLVPEDLFLLPLQYAELKPVPCLSYSDAVKLRESCATPILTQVLSSSDNR